jgi:peptidyl-prolyl cis-trans isomerase D
MMRQMRDNMKWIMALTAITFVGLMVFGWGMDITGRTSADATGGELGRVDGEPISYQEWNTVVQNMYEARQRQGGPINAAVNKQIQQDAWDQLVMQKLVGQELRRRGIDVTESEVRQAARFAPPPEFMNNPAFQTNGQFDLNKYHQVLQTQADDQLLMQLEAYYRELIPRSKLFYQATTGSFLPDGELWRMWKDGRDQARVKFIFFDPTTLIPDNRVTVAPRDVERYYREHKDDFEKPAHAQVKYVVIDRTPNATDSAAVRARTQQVRQELVGGAKFEDVAKRESADSVSAAQGGNLGKIIKGGNTVPAFEQAVFSLPVNQLSEPVETRFGYHLIQVQKRTADTAEVRHILIPFKPQQAREDQLLTMADSLENLGADQSLEEAARALGLPVQTGELEPGIAFLPGAGQVDDGGIWAFDEAEVGEVSEVFESPNAYYMLQLVERTEKGTRTLDEARPTITARLMLEKKSEEARQIARRALDRIRSGGTIEQGAEAVGLKVQEAGPFTRLDFVPGMGRANAAVGTAFGMKPGQVSGVVEADGALFIIQTVELKEADRAEFEKQKVAQNQRVGQALSEQRWSQYLQALRDGAKIVDNRETMLRRSGQTSTTN